MDGDTLQTPKTEVGKYIALGFASRAHSRRAVTVHKTGQAYRYEVEEQNIVH